MHFWHFPRAFFFFVHWLTIFFFGFSTFFAIFFAFFLGDEDLVLPWKEPDDLRLRLRLVEREGRLLLSSASASVMMRALCRESRERRKAGRQKD
jgi:hypothetical protein